MLDELTPLLCRIGHDRPSRLAGTSHLTRAFLLRRKPSEEPTMSDPRYDGGIPPSDYMRDHPQSTSYIAAGVVAVLLVVGLILYSASGDRTSTASNPASETTGRSERAPMPPKPAPTVPGNPM